MFKTTYTHNEQSWLHDNYFSMDWKELGINFHLKFKRKVCGKSLRRKCYNDGLRKQLFGINNSLYRKADGRKRSDNLGKKMATKTKFNIQCTRLGLVEALMKGHSPI